MQDAPIKLTAYAIARYREYWAPTDGLALAEDTLRGLLMFAEFVEYQGSHEIWAARVAETSDPVLLVVANRTVQTVLLRGSRPAKARVN